MLQHKKNINSMSHKMGVGPFVSIENSFVTSFLWISGNQTATTPPCAIMWGHLSLVGDALKSAIPKWTMLIKRKIRRENAGN